MDPQFTPMVRAYVNVSPWIPVLLKNHFIISLWISFWFTNKQSLSSFRLLLIRYIFTKSILVKSAFYQIQDLSEQTQIYLLAISQQQLPHLLLVHQQLLLQSQLLLKLLLESPLLQLLPQSEMFLLHSQLLPLLDLQQVS